MGTSLTTVLVSTTKPKPYLLRVCSLRARAVGGAIGAFTGWVYSMVLSKVLAALSLLMTSFHSSAFTSESPMISVMNLHHECGALSPRNLSTKVSVSPSKFSTLSRTGFAGYFSSSLQRVSHSALSSSSVAGAFSSVFPSCSGASTLVGEVAAFAAAIFCSASLFWTNTDSANPTWWFDSDFRYCVVI